MSGPLGWGVQSPAVSVVDNSGQQLQAPKLVAVPVAVWLVWERGCSHHQEPGLNLYGELQQARPYDGGELLSNSPKQVPCGVLFFFFYSCSHMVCCSRMAWGGS